MGVFEDLTAHAALSFERARMLPVEAYREPDVLRAEIAELFGRDWLCVGRMQDLVHDGDHLVAEIPAPGGSRSVLVVRDRGEVRAFDNVCVHRGARLVDCSGTTAARFTCPYHAWSYRLDGSLIGAPHIEGDRLGEVALGSIAVSTWQGFVFVNQDPGAAPRAPRLAGLAEIIERYEPAGYEVVHRERLVWNTNWKLLVENFIDAYHVFHVHRASFGADGDSTADTEVHPGTHAWTHHRVVERSGPDLAAPASPLRGDWRKTIVLAAVFPGLVLQLQPDWMWSLRLQPRGTESVMIDAEVSISVSSRAAVDDVDAWTRDLVAFLDRVNGEDRPVVEGVASSMAGPQFTRGPWSSLERNVFDFDRYVATRLAGAAQASRSS
ncbi:MAG: aromatic ring-hydroxylating dioxygenase subunit alpha [Actinomycetota bacterium]